MRGLIPRIKSGGAHEECLNGPLGCPRPATPTRWRARGLFPPGFPFTVPPCGGVGLLPLRDRAGLVVVHLLVHADAVGADDGWCPARLVAVVLDALIDPLEVVRIHLLCSHWTGPDAGGEQTRDDHEPHATLPFGDPA